MNFYAAYAFRVNLLFENEAWLFLLWREILEEEEEQKECPRCGSKKVRFEKILTYGFV